MAESLFERLKKRAEEKPQPPAPEVEDDLPPLDGDGENEPVQQCECGSHIAGECPECDAPNGNDEPDIMKRLRTIGDSQGVNRPSDDGGGASSGMCPLCGKTFRHLSRHKCKEAPEILAVPADDNAAPEETRVLHACKSCGKALVVELADGVQTDVAKYAGVSGNMACVECIQAENAAAAQGQPGIQPDGSYLTPPERKAKAQAKSRADFGSKVSECAGGGEFILVLDAVVDKGMMPSRFDDFILPFCEAVAKENQLDHWSLADYGRGPGLLAAKVERFFSEGNTVHMMMVGSSESAEMRAVKSILTRYAKQVIQGVR